MLFGLQSISQICSINPEWILAYWKRSLTICSQAKKTEKKFTSFKTKQTKLFMEQTPPLETLKIHAQRSDFLWIDCQLLQSNQARQTCWNGNSAGMFTKFDVSIVGRQHPILKTEKEEIQYWEEELLLQWSILMMAATAAAAAFECHCKNCPSIEEVRKIQFRPSVYKLIMLVHSLQVYRRFKG